MASPTFRQVATAGGAAAANVTINVPAGTANGDVMIVFLSKDDTGAVGWPGGWNILGENTRNSFYGGVGWRIAASEPASYTWTFTSIWRDCAILSYQGADTSGVPLDPDSLTTVFNSPIATGSQTAMAPNITTTTPATVVLAMYQDNSIAGWGSAPSGWTSRIPDGMECQVIDRAAATAGTTVGPTMPFSGSTGNIKQWTIAIQSLPDQRQVTQLMRVG